MIWALLSIAMKQSIYPTIVTTIHKIAIGLIIVVALVYSKPKKQILSKGLKSYRAQHAHSFCRPEKHLLDMPEVWSELVYIHKLGICKKCGFMADRDSVRAINVWLKFVYAYTGGPGLPREPFVLRCLFSFCIYLLCLGAFSSPTTSMVALLPMEWVHWASGSAAQTP